MWPSTQAGWWRHQSASLTHVGRRATIFEETWIIDVYSCKKRWKKGWGKGERRREKGEKREKQKKKKVKKWNKGEKWEKE